MNPSEVQNPVLSWPLDPVTQQSLRRWLGEGTSDLKYIVWRVLDSATFQTVGTTFGGDFECPFSGVIRNVYAFVDTAGVTGSGTYDINIAGTTILSTKITVETTEKSSRNATTAPVLSTTAVTVGDIFTVDIDAIQTTPAKGLTVVITVTI
jgi:hypothetical protein